MSNYPIYYRVVAKSGHVSTLQSFDEDDYDPSIWLTGPDGKPAKFDDEGEARRAGSDRILGLIAERNELSNFLRGIAGQEGVWIGPIEGEKIALQLMAHGYRKPGCAA